MGKQKQRHMSAVDQNGQNATQIHILRTELFMCSIDCLSVHFVTLTLTTDSCVQHFLSPLSQC